MQLTPTGAGQRFGPGFVVALIVVLQMFTMFSTDMYAPSLPSMVAQFNEPEQVVSMTISVFFVFSIVGTLFLGPVSDKIGRRPMLLACVGVYIAASVGCAAAQSIAVLIGLRVFQALACGGIQSLTLAVVKDTYVGRSRESVLMITQAISVIGPILAPVFGAQLLVWFSWRATFVVLTALGACGLALVLIFRESLPADEHTAGSVLGSFKGLARVARNGRFMVFMLVTSIFFALPFYLYLNTSSFIYQDFFGLTPVQYSYFFAATAGLSVGGLLYYNLVRGHVSLRRLTWGLILVAVGIGAALLLVGQSSPWVFFVLMLLFQGIGAVCRPYSVNTLFALQVEDTGAASSMLNCSFSLFGIVGMLPGVLAGGNYVVSMAVLVTIGGLASLVLWVALLRSRAEIPGITQGRSPKP